MLEDRLAVCAPEIGVIIDARLLAAGFKTSLRLARRIEALFRLCATRLSVQHHYDFSVRGVSRVVGAICEAKSRGSELGADKPSVATEQALAVRAVRTAIGSGLVPSDRELFEALLWDVFPDQTRTQLGEQEAVRQYLLSALCPLRWSARLVAKTMELSQI